MDNEEPKVLTNAEVSAVLECIGELLEIEGGEVFKVRAYQRAAQAVDSLHESVARVSAEGRLLDVPGIGKAICLKIDEILKTGTCRFYEDLKAKVPPGVVEMLHIPGVGPKKAGVLFRDHGLTSVADLKAAAEAGKLRNFPGMGKKTEENILAGIVRMQEKSDRLPIGVMRPYAEVMAAALREVPGTERVEIAGSLRRWRETAKDMDLVAVSSEPKKLMDAFTALPEAARVVMKGDTRTTILTQNGIQADLRVVAPGQFAALLNHFTGSQGHNIRLRSIANSRGLKINEYGVFKDPGDEPVALGDDEAALYDLLGLQFVPPEMREDTGEVEAAAAGKVPRLLELADLRCDLHCHTFYSDGAQSVDEMAQAARARGYSHLAIADHSQSLVVAHGLSVEEIRKQIREIREWNEKNADSGFRLLAGTECDILGDGSLDWPDDVLEELDVVVASIHSRMKMEEKEMTARIVRALETGKVSILGHPTGRLLGSRDPYAVNMEQVFAAALRTGTCVEIDGHPSRLDLNDQHARLAKQMGLRIAVDSDAHSVEGLDVIHYGVHCARRAWLTAEDVVNTYPVERLLEVLRRGR